MIRRFAPLLTLFSLAACAGEHHDPYPSLAPRPVEQRGFDEPTRPAGVAAPDTALDAQIVQRGAELDRITGSFNAAAAAARQRVAAASHAAVGSEAWLDAQAAMARLDDWRTQETSLAASIEALGSARAAALQPAYPALDALAGRAGAEGDREQAEAEGLQQSLPGA